MQVDHDALFAKLEAEGEEAVKINYAKGNIYAGTKANLVHEWLQSKEHSRSEAASTKRDTREEETLSIAKSALSIAKDANRIASDDLSVARDSAKSARSNAKWAMYAAIIAIIAAVISTKDQILALIF